MSIVFALVGLTCLHTAAVAAAVAAAAHGQQQPGCSGGYVPCPPGLPSAGVCVPAVAPWCALDLFLIPWASDAARSTDLIARLTPAQRVNLLQTTPVQDSGVPSLGIAASTTAECLHGYCSRSPSSLFPQSTTLAASFNPELVTRVAAAVGMEGRAWRNAWVRAGNASIPPPSLTCFAPQINIVRDPRWGRAQETYGECPFLTSRMAGAYVRGLQGDPQANGGYLLAAASAKHFVGYQGASSRGQWSPTEVYLSWRDQVDTYERAWEEVVAAGTASIMCAYSSLCHDDTNTTCVAQYGVSHGVPMCADDELLNGWLRGDLGWDGVVTGDCGAVQFIQTDHLWADSQEGAAAAALNAGTDFDCSVDVGQGFAALLNATALGLVNQSSIDTSLSRLLRLQLRLGYFDPPDMVPYASIPMGAVNSPAHRGLAAAAAREGIVLLRNLGESSLPLRAADFTRPGSLLVTGPNAQLIASGNYNSQTDTNITAWDGVAAVVPPPIAVLSAGCSMSGNDTSGIGPAAAAAAAADAVIVVCGLDGTVEYEDSTRASLSLPGVQEQLIGALAATGTPVILVIMGGSGVAVSQAALGSVAAVVWAGYGGEEAGTALADVLFGAYNPGGRLPFTFYADAGDLPPYLNMSMVGLPFGRTYRYYTGPAPVFRFGEGISYSSFTHTGLRVPATRLAPCDSLQLSVTVTNTSPLGGDVVTQVYVRLLNLTNSPVPATASGYRQRRGSGSPPSPGGAPDPPLLTPLQSLEAFNRSYLAPSGALLNLTFTLPPRAFAVVDPVSQAWVQFPAVVGLFVGSQSPAGEADWGGPQGVQVQLLGPPTPLSACTLDT